MEVSLLWRATFPCGAHVITTPPRNPETLPRNPTPKPHPETPPRNPEVSLEECACGSVLAVARHVTMRGARHHDPTPKPHPETLKSPTRGMCMWKCPCCGVPRFRAGRMSSRPHPETPPRNPESSI